MKFEPQNYLLKITHQAKFYFDMTIWMVSANAQFVIVTEKTISVVHVSRGSAAALVTAGGTTNRHSITHSLLNICTKNYHNRLMCVEVTVCNISVVFRRNV